jgi:hypothetical protein
VNLQQLCVLNNGVASAAAAMELVAAMQDLRQLFFLGAWDTMVPLVCARL